MFYVRVKYSSCLQQCRNYKNQTSFSRVMVANVLPHFHEHWSSASEYVCLSLAAFSHYCTDQDVTWEIIGGAL